VRGDLLRTEQAAERPFLVGLELRLPAPSLAVIQRAVRIPVEAVAQQLHDLLIPAERLV
jgi:hypothetical protein